EVRFAIGNTPGGGTIKMSIAPDAVDPRSARTRYRVIERFAHHTLVLAQPFTGRLHQIRLHMSGMGHPVASDEFYSHSPTLTLGELFGDAPAAYPAAVAGQDGATPLLTRQALHAHRLVFMHPIRLELMTVTAELSPDMQRVLELLRSKVASAS